MDDRKYDFFAFISYKREDEKWAKWLQRKLEYYKLPSSVRKDNPDLPEKIRPVFKDTTDLEPGVLARKIQDALDSSKYLIVICSPRSANSVWVSKEVQAFIDSGRSDHIIPFIIGGVPNAADPKDECFPEGLRQLAGEQELLGANINEMGREAAAIKVVARMFNLRFDTLWQRYEKRKRKRRVAVISALIIIIMICIGVGMYISRQNRLLEKTNESLIVETKRANAERDRANEERNRANDFNIKLIDANDSIKRGYIRLDSAKRSLAQLNTDLKQSNIDLLNEKQKVEKALFDLTQANSAKRLAENFRLLDQSRELIRSGNAVGALIRIAKDDADSLYMTILEPAIREALDSVNFGKFSIAKYSKLPYDIMQIEIDRRHGVLYASDGSTIKVWNIETQENTNEISCPNDMSDIGYFDVNDKYNLISISEGRGNITKLFRLLDFDKGAIYESLGYGIFFDNTTDRLWECKNIGHEKAEIIVKSIATRNVLDQFGGCIMGINPSGSKFVYSTFNKNGEIENYYLYDTTSGQQQKLNIEAYLGDILLDDSGQCVYHDYNEGKALLKNNTLINTDKIRECLSYEDGLAIKSKDGLWTLTDGHSEEILYGLYDITAIRKFNNRYLLLGFANGTISTINNPFYRNSLYTITPTIEREIEYFDKRLDISEFNNNHNFFCARLSNDKSLIGMGMDNGAFSLIDGNTKLVLNQFNINRCITYIDFTPDNKYIGIIADNNDLIIYRKNDFVQVANYNIKKTNVDVVLHSFSFEENDEYYIARIYGSQYTGPDISDMPYGPETNAIIWENYHPVECSIAIPKFEKVLQLSKTTRIK